MEALYALVIGLECDHGYARTIRGCPRLTDSLHVVAIARYAPMEVRSSGDRVLQNLENVFRNDGLTNTVLNDKDMLDHDML